MNKQEYNNSYNKNNYTGISFRLSNTNEKDLIRWLESQENTKGYIVSLIRADMDKRQKQQRKLENAYHEMGRDLPYEVLEDLPYNDHHSVAYAGSLLEALKRLEEFTSSSDPMGRVSIIERDFDRDLNCAYGIRKGSTLV